MGAEQRRNERKPIDRRAWVIREDGSYVAECVLGDISDTGAKLIFTALPDLPAEPEEFVLRLSLDGRVARKCLLAWKAGNEAGVRFIAKLRSRTIREVHAMD